MNPAENALRKLVRTGPENTSNCGPLLAQALTQAVSRAMRAGFDIEGEFTGPEFAEHDLNGLIEDMPTPGLLVVLADGTGPVGVLWLAPLLVNALVELMTGAPENAVYRVEREPTPTDAALCRDSCIRLLDLFRTEISSEDKKIPALGWQAFETEAARLRLVLADGEYSCLKGGISLQGGVRGGQIGLALAARLLDAGATQQASPSEGGFAAALWDNVRHARLRLRAELEVMTLPLGEALALKAGDVLPVPENALSDLTLRASDGKALFKGHLGQADGRKAVSVTGIPGNPDQPARKAELGEDGAEPGAPPDAEAAANPAESPQDQDESEADAGPVSLAAG